MSFKTASFALVVNLSICSLLTSMQCSACTTQPSSCHRGKAPRVLQGVKPACTHAHALNHQKKLLPCTWKDQFQVSS